MCRLCGGKGIYTEFDSPMGADVFMDGDGLVFEGSGGVRYRIACRFCPECGEKTAGHAMSGGGGCGFCGGRHVAAERLPGTEDGDGVYYKMHAGRGLALVDRANKRQYDLGISFCPSCGRAMAKPAAPAPGKERGSEKPCPLCEEQHGFTEPGSKCKAVLSIHGTCFVARGDLSDVYQAGFEYCPQCGKKLTDLPEYDGQPAAGRDGKGQDPGRRGNA